MNVWEKRFKLPQLTHESFLAIDHSCKIFFWYLPNWTSTNLWCVVLYVTYSTTHRMSVEVQFGRYQKNILQEWSMVKNLSCVSHGSLKRFPHKFTSAMVAIVLPWRWHCERSQYQQQNHRTRYWVPACSSSTKRCHCTVKSFLDNIKLSFTLKYSPSLGIDCDQRIQNNIQHLPNQHGLLVNQQSTIWFQNRT